MDAAPQDRVADYRIDLTRLLYMFYMDQEQQLARAARLGHAAARRRD